MTADISGTKASRSKAGSSVKVGGFCLTENHKVFERRSTSVPTFSAHRAVRVRQNAEAWNFFWQKKICGATSTCRDKGGGGDRRAGEKGEYFKSWRSCAVRGAGGGGWTLYFRLESSLFAILNLSLDKCFTAEVENEKLYKIELSIPMFLETMWNYYCNQPICSY